MYQASLPSCYWLFVYLWLSTTSRRIIIVIMMWTEKIYQIYFKNNDYKLVDECGDHESGQIFKKRTTEEGMYELREKGYPCIKWL